MMKYSRPGKSRPAAATDSSRRSFITRIGAGVSAGLASTAGLAGGAPGSDDAALQAALLIEEKALRKLQQSYQQAIDSGLFAEAAALFADDAQVAFNGGVFRGWQGVSRLLRGQFVVSRSGRHMQPAPGFEPVASELEDIVTVAPDRLSAAAAFPFSIQMGKPIETETSHASMARLQGEGVQTWWEGGVCDMAFRRGAVAEVWKISRLEYRVLARADYRPGRSWVGPIAASPLAMRYPDDPHGPDFLYG